MSEKSMRYFEQVVNECSFEAAAGDPRTSDVASALCLARAGVEFDGLELADRLGSVAEFYHLGPDDMQAILQRHEPKLAEDWMM